MAFAKGKDAKVMYFASNVLGMGTWSMSGVNVEVLEDTEFGDTWKTFQYGMKDGGEVSFSGLLDVADSTGFMALAVANLDATSITALKLYVDATSYWEPCQTTEYFAPGFMSTNANTVPSSIIVTSIEIGQDKSGLATVSFSGKVSGVMVLI